MNCQKSGLDTVGSSISIVDLLRNDDASIDDHKYFELQISDCEIVENLPKWAKIPNLDRQKMADLLMKMASNKKMQENKPILKFNFTIEKR